MRLDLSRIVLAMALAVVVLPAVAADLIPSQPTIPEALPAEGCRWVEVRQPLPGETVPQVFVDPDGCFRDAVRRVIGWG